MISTNDRPVEDADLLSRYVHGADGEAFGAIVAKYGGFVRNVCGRCLFTHSLFADDAAQTVFVVLARRADSIGRGIQLPAWLHRVAVNVCRNISRSELSRSRRERRESEETATTRTVAPLEDEEQRVLTVKRLHECIDALSESDRNVLILRYFDNRSCRSIAQTAGVTEDSVNVRLSRARAKLRQALQKKGVVMSAALLVAALDAEHASAMTAPVVSVDPIGGRFAQDTADAVTAEMDRAAAKAMWWKMGAAAGLAMIGAGTALVVSHLQSATVESATVWRIESVMGSPSVRRDETMRMLKAGDVLCAGDRIITTSNQEAQVTSDGGDRILVREEGEVRFEHPTLNTEHRTSKLGEGNSQVRVVCGAIVAELKNPVRFATPHAAIQSDTGTFFLMVASGLTSNRVPWSFSRLDVTEGQVRFRSSETQVSSFEFPVSSHQFAVVGTDHEGKIIETRVRESKGRELSPKNGGMIFREYAQLYTRNERAFGALHFTKGRVLLETNGWQMLDKLTVHDSGNVNVGKLKENNAKALGIDSGTGGTVAVSFPLGLPSVDAFEVGLRVSFALTIKPSHNCGLSAGLDDIPHSIWGRSMEMRTTPAEVHPTGTKVLENNWFETKERYLLVGSTLEGCPIYEVATAPHLGKVSVPSRWGPVIVVDWARIALDKIKITELQRKEP